MTRKVIITSSSHFDREWYYSFEKFRIQISEVINKVILLLERYPEQYRFMLDGQTSILEDYLEIYPEKEEKLKELIHNGKLLIGPWYIQPDELIPCAESHVRNLLIGNMVSALYGKAMKIGYIPDAFGHISQMPQILNGFGIHKAFISRGVDSETGREFKWESPDGSSVLAVHMNYGNCCRVDFNNMIEGIRIIDNPVELKANIEKLIRNNGSVSSIPHVLLMYNGDHCAPPMNLIEMADEINSNENGFSIEIGILNDYFDAIDNIKPALKTVKGELRKSADMFTLKDTLASRMYLKLENQKAQRILIHFAEPVSSLAWIEGCDYPKGFLDMAWKYLVSNHTHDGICGCSADIVHNEMMMRFRKCLDISERLTELGLKYIAEKIDTSNIDNKDVALIIFNPLSFETEECIKVDIVFRSKEKPDFIKLFDMQGNEVQYQLLGVETRARFESDINAVQKFFDEKVFNIIFNPYKIPAFGYKTFKAAPEFNVNDFYIEGKRPESLLKYGFNYMENGYLRVEINYDGTLNITDLENGIAYNNVHYFEDNGDAGDVYTYIEPEIDLVYNSRNLKWNISLVNKGSVVITYRLETEMHLPVSLSKDKVARSSVMVPNTVQYDVSLSVSGRYVSIKAKIVNNSSDHRLRVMFPTNINTDYSYAEGQYAVEKRKIGEFPYFHPQQTFTDINDGLRGVAILNKGIPQYEVINDGSNTVALTLLKCQDTFYRAFFKTCNDEFKGAQCKGEYIFEYAFYPHKGDCIQGKVHKNAHFFNTGVFSVLSEKHQGVIPFEKGYVEIEPDELIITAVKKSVEGNKLVVRFYNTAGYAVEGKIKFTNGLKSASLLTLSEEPVEELLSEGNTLPIVVNPYKIMTIAVGI